MRPRGEPECPTCVAPIPDVPALPAPTAVEDEGPTPREVRHRLTEVVSALMLAGLDTPMARMRVTHCATWRCRAHCTWRRWTGHAPTGHTWPLALRNALVELGPAFVKIGQILSVRTDLVPPEMARVLHTLQSDVPAVPFDELRGALPIGGWLTRVEEEPLAAGSIAQVHVGWLADGRRVAVKVKRPGIDAVMRLDLEVLHFLAEQLERHWPASRPYRPVAAAEELRRYTLRELDFRQEASVARRLREHFAERSGSRVLIPEVHFASTGLIVMEFIEGFPADRRERYAEHGLDARDVLHVGIDAVIRQVLELGLFHADPHPGNLYVTPDGKVAMLDFGIFGELDARLTRQCALLMWALTRGDVQLASQHLVRIADIGPGADVAGFRRAVETLYRAWRGSNIREYGLGRLVFDELTLGARYGLEFPSDVILVGKALVTIEGVIAWVDPEVDLVEELQPFVSEVARKLFDPTVLASEVVRALPTWFDLIEHLPLGLATALERGLSPPPPPPRTDRGTTLGPREWGLFLGVALLAAGVASVSVELALALGAVVLAALLISRGSGDS